MKKDLLAKNRAHRERVNQALINKVAIPDDVPGYIIREFKTMFTQANVRNTIYLKGAR